MLKKFYVLLISFVFLGNCCASASDDINQRIINEVILSVAPYLSEETDCITRDECVTTIIKIIGADEKVAKYFTDADYYAPVFIDVNFFIHENFGYIYAANACGVANGIPAREPTLRKFEPDRAVTVKETLAFTLRCLTDSKSLLWENTINDSLKFGLIEESESENYKFEEPIKKEQFYIVLCRLLNSKRYLYWSEECHHINNSENRITYIDAFNEK